MSSSVWLPVRSLSVVWVHTSYLFYYRFTNIFSSVLMALCVSFKTFLYTFSLWGAVLILPWAHPFSPRFLVASAYGLLRRKCLSDTKYLYLVLRMSLIGERVWSMLERGN